MSSETKLQSDNKNNQVLTNKQLTEIWYHLCNAINLYLSDYHKYNFNKFLIYNYQMKYYIVKYEKSNNFKDLLNSISQELSKHEILQKFMLEIMENKSEKDLQLEKQIDNKLYLLKICKTEKSYIGFFKIETEILYNLFYFELEKYEN